MYNDSISRRKTMGDVDVLWHDGEYHLFHLVLPSHDYVAHAVSQDGLNWERVENALFIGHPGGWDDHMLWTVHVSRDPHRPGQWRMFYTGLSRGDCGAIQRIGLARSGDLRHWEKVRDVARPAEPHDSAAARGRESAWPLAAEPPHYEHQPQDGRTWVSFRDPFYYHDGERGWLLMAARTSHGPGIRRGCVGLAEEVAPDVFDLRPPLHRPGQYDDIEAPNLFQLQSRHYLVGSIREDAKIRYWCADTMDGPWGNFFDNVLLAGGNYAGRISFDDHGPLIWNFYTPNPNVRDQQNLMPPPKRLACNGEGRLRAASFEAFDRLDNQLVEGRDLTPLAPLLENQHAKSRFEPDSSRMTLTSEAGFEAFLLRPRVGCFRFSARLEMSGLGKCGLAFRVDPESTDGYYLSLDLLKGVAQVRAWGHREGPGGEQAFEFNSLQAGYWRPAAQPGCDISLLALGNYLEFSIDGCVLLSLADGSYSAGRLGLYVESACLQVQEPRLEHLQTLTHPTSELPAG